MNKIEKFIAENIDRIVRDNAVYEESFLEIPHPFYVPCSAENFQSFFYWDVYFINRAFFWLGKNDIAKGNCDNIRHLIKNYGFMPNMNRTWSLGRSHPPFYSLIVGDMFEKTGDLSWLSESYEALKLEHEFWQSERRFPEWLNFYLGNKVTRENYGEFYKEFTWRTGYPETEDVDEKVRRGQCYMAFCESAYDCTFRLGDAYHEYAQVDLNSLLYGMERDLERFAKMLGTGEEKLWGRRAESRKALMNEYMWSDDTGDFNDAAPDGRRGTVFGVHSFYPLFTGLAAHEQAKSIVKKLPLIECEYGVASTESFDTPCICQWDYPNGWAPQQYITVKALLNYGYEADAKRIAEKFTRLVEECFDETGNLWEKYDVVNGGLSHAHEKTLEFYGWTAGVYLELKNMFE